MGAPTNSAQVKKVLANSEPSTHGGKADMRDRRQSNDRLVLALSTWICIPMARAGAATSLNVVSVVAALAGLTSTATRVAAGTRSRRSSSRFAVNSPL